MKTVCVYCGSSPGNNPAYVAAAQALGKALVRNQMGLVYGGASVGIMGEIAAAVLDAGGEVTGVIPQALVRKEVSHHGLTELKVVASMHERKAVMAELADGFIALPGGFGTFEELFEILTWSQLGFHQKPCGLLNVAHYYDQLIGFLDQAVSSGFVRESHRQMLMVAEDPGVLLDAMLEYRPPQVDKWIGRGET